MNLQMMEHIAQLKQKDKEILDPKVEHSRHKGKHEPQQGGRGQQNESRERIMAAAVAAGAGLKQDVRTCHSRKCSRVSSIFSEVYAFVVTCTLSAQTKKNEAQDAHFLKLQE